MRKIDFIHYSQLHKKTKNRWRYVESAVFVFILIIFLLKMTGYLHLQNFTPAKITHSVATKYRDVSFSISELKYFGKCPKNEIKIIIGQQYLCRKSAQSSIYLNIYDLHPRNSYGKDVIYPPEDNNSIKQADDILRNTYDIERYSPAKLSNNLTWNEDPYKDRYWRFNFYSLRPLETLLNAWKKTGDKKYEEKLQVLTNSFLDNGMRQPHSWDDNHAVAFRTIILINIWSELRQNNDLSIETSTKILQALEKHGDFLNDRNHYEPQHNHGTNEAASLFLLGHNFPELKNSKQWQDTSKLRITSGLVDLVDDDGSLIENSPYYHFYTLQKYWDIYKYSIKYDAPLGDSFESKIYKMINYGTYILQPNSQPPLIGSSLATTVNKKNEFADIANKSPEFKYVLTHGKEGKVPASQSIYFKKTGQAILRSGWDKRNYTQQTQTIVDVGQYRTKHSHLDALSVNVYGAGLALLPDAGLYSYDESDLHDYFHGTSSHNTVMVDGKDQSEGSAIAGKFESTKDYSYISGEESLNTGVVHDRIVIQIGRETIFIVDKLKSETEHDYSQQFHVFPGAKLKQNGLDIAAQGNKTQQRVGINQLTKKGLILTDKYNILDKPAGLCSTKYNHTEGCHQLEYHQHGKNVEYITAIQIGKKHKDISYTLSSDKSTIFYKKGNKKIEIKLGADKKTNPIIKTGDTTKKDIPGSKINILNSTDGFTVENANVSMQPDISRSNKTSLTISTTNNLPATIQKNVSMDLTSKNLLFYLKVKNISNVSHIELTLSSNNEAGYVTTRLGNAYSNNYDSQWVGISLGKTKFRDRGGQWTEYGQGFDWGKIDKIKFLIQSKDENSVEMQIADMALLNEQSAGKVIPVFDDGYDTVLDALPIMNKYKIKGNVAVISRYPERHQKGYLTLEEIKRLQNNYGWNIINHSDLHKAAVEDYYAKNDLSNFESDILHGAKYLNDNGINSDPNWYIYPHGSTNDSIKNIVSKYYRYARSTQNGPEVYPFGDPLGVKTFAVQNDTSPDAVKNAIRDAKTYHTTLFLTFHRIESSPTDRQGYKINDFEEVMKFIKSSDIQSMTFKDYDKSNGIPINAFEYIDGKPEQISASFKVKEEKFWQNIL